MQNAIQIKGLDIQKHPLNINDKLKHIKNQKRYRQFNLLNTR